MGVIESQQSGTLLIVRRQRISQPVWALRRRLDLPRFELCPATPGGSTSMTYPSRSSSVSRLGSLSSWNRRARSRPLTSYPNINSGSTTAVCQLSATDTRIIHRQLRADCFPRCARQETIRMSELGLSSTRANASSALVGPSFSATASFRRVASIVPRQVDAPHRHMYSR